MTDIRTSRFGSIPSGNTASRPPFPILGDTYYNGELEILEIYNGTQWVANSAPPAVPSVTSVTDVGDRNFADGAALTAVITPGSGGATALQYNASTTTGGFSASSSTTTVTLTGLTPNTSFVVVANAQNNFGTTVNSNPFNAVLATTRPQKPTIGTATINGGTATINWTAPNNGGKVLTGYTITASTGGFSASAASSATSATIGGLNAGTSYTFTVVATNANGNSPASDPSNSVTATLTADVLVVGGGGGGGGGETNQQGGQGGGGGGGSFRYETNVSLSPATTYTVTVGGGGGGGSAACCNDSSSGTKGGQSVFGSITAEGGGLGGGDFFAGGAGGSAGGSGGDNGSVTQPTNSAYGNAGGSYTGYRSGLGGGGKGSAGASNSMNGGSAQSNSITGSAQSYAGGGGGGRANQDPISNGGIGGTNAGNGGNGGGGGAGTANFGGGGGGGSASNGGSGGSGVVIARIASDSTSGITTTGSPTITTDGSFTIYKWTGSGSLVTP